MNKSILMILLIAMVALAGCGGDAEQTAANDVATTSESPAAEVDHGTAAADADVWRGTVAETMDAGGYSYVLLDMDGEQRWIAGPVTAVAVGDKLITGVGMEMRNFKSNALDRTFDAIYFVGSMETDDGKAKAETPASDPHAGTGMGGMGGMGGTGGGASEHMSLDNAGVQGVEPVAGGMTVAEIYAGSTNLTDRTVKVRGRVVKFTRNIMGTNWIHIQDGTGSEGTHDLTVTTGATVQVGDLVLVEGPVSVDRDFGAGYLYAVIIEGAQITVE